MAILGIQRDSSGSGWVVPTEIAATGVGLVMGIGGGLAQLLFSNRLSEVSGSTVSLASMLIPALGGLVGAVGGVFLAPLTEGGSA